MDKNSAPHSAWIASGGPAPLMSDHHFMHRSSGMSVPAPIGVGWEPILVPAIVRLSRTLARAVRGRLDRSRRTGKAMLPQCGDFEASSQTKSPAMLQSALAREQGRQGRG